jgi:hypothetical protein
MSSHQLTLRTIDELRQELFHVPSYQRGYRWTATQVVELLDDVWDFIRGDHKPKGGFYCLQPVVVAPLSDGTWSVIDGQQRLTTIFLILSFFNEGYTEQRRKKLYSISYETRPASAEFLKAPQDERKKENIDFFHIVEARDAIRAWCDGKDVHFNDIESAFLLHVRVIWYELGSDSNPMAVFQRLNLGKIPLSDGELVKALLLRSNNFAGDEPRLLQLRQLQIAGEWDAMERRLQEDEFWFFLTNQDREANRVELLLKLRSNELPQVEGHPWQGSDLFHAFARRFAEPDVDAWKEWSEIRRIFLTLEEWFRDDALHHLVGFLTCTASESADPHSTIMQVLSLSATTTDKRGFRRALKDLIHTRCFRQAAARLDGDVSTSVRQSLAELDYDKHPTAIRNVLLLFNLASILESGDARSRFPFDVFKRDKWDIEHIRSVQSRMPERTDAQKRWLEHFESYLGGGLQEEDGLGTDVERAALLRESKSLREAEKFDNVSFEQFFGRVLQTHDPDRNPEADNSIGNLTLLDAATNRGYGNALFPIKRKTIIALDKVGRFVPLCTKNVFLKYYSPRVDKMLVWSSADTRAHANAIQERLTTFFSDKETQ